MAAPVPVRYERRGAAAVLTIDRPARRNAIDGATAAALLDGLRRFEADDGARALVLTGAGGEAFCAGADLKALDTLDPDLPGGPLGFTRFIASKPTIAAIEGWCLAGGFELALWCDLRVVSRAATFGFFERRFGVPLVDGGTQRLPRIVGLGRALELILTGRPVAAGEALAIGLATELVEPGAALERALALAEALAAVPQETMLSDRRATYDGIGRELADGLAREHEIGAAVRDVAARGAARFAGGEGRGGGSLPAPAPRNLSRGG